MPDHTHLLLSPLRDDISGFGRKAPAVVCGESDEDWPVVFLNVGKMAAVIILRLHKPAALFAA
jgi:hypothetical protein